VPRDTGGEPHGTACRWHVVTATTCQPVYEPVAPPELGLAELDPLDPPPPM
jgi:hypothetical protein